MLHCCSRKAQSPQRLQSSDAKFGFCWISGRPTFQARLPVYTVAPPTGCVMSLLPVFFFFFFKWHRKTYRRPFALPSLNPPPTPTELCHPYTETGMLYLSICSKHGVLKMNTILTFTENNNFVPLSCLAMTGCVLFGFALSLIKDPFGYHLHSVSEFIRDFTVTW